VFCALGGVLAGGEVASVELEHGEYLVWIDFGTHCTLFGTLLVQQISC